MEYRLKQNGVEVGTFPMEELRQRVLTGTLTGDELVWRQGMNQWIPLKSILAMSTPPPAPSAPPSDIKEDSNWLVTAGIIFGICIIVAGTVYTGFWIFKSAPVLRQYFLRHLVTSRPATRPSAMDAAREPVVFSASTRTCADVQKTGRAFRIRQYLQGYQDRGERNPESDLLAQQFLTNWIDGNFGGPVDTNLPPVSEIGDRLAADPHVTDPLILMVSAVNSTELHEAIRRLERSVTGFENSKHRAYPKLYATVTLSDKIFRDRAARVPVLDAQALQQLKDSFTDGSLQPTDEEEVADALINTWGRHFFARNSAAICSLVQQQGGSYEWLALVLDGEMEINRAWDARGTGYADTVTQNGWQGFEDHLAAARKSLTRAWTLHRERPLAPSLMITVSLGASDITEMRRWFDRTTTAQIDYPGAWTEMRWGLRPRWNGDTRSMLAFGITALNTRRFDTDVPRQFFDSLSNVEDEMGLSSGEHLYGREYVWPYLQELYEGYVAEPSLAPDVRDGWRSTYSVVASLAGKYEIARKQLEALHWAPHPDSLTGWGHDLSLMPAEVAARTGPKSAQVNAAELLRNTGDLSGALKAYQNLSLLTSTDALTQQFVDDRMVTLTAEQHLAAGEWIDFLPHNDQLTGWHVGFGKFTVMPDASLQVEAGQQGHLIYSRVRMGLDFEVRGQFEVVSSTTKAFQAGLVMGMPDWSTYDWYAFRIKRNDDEKDVASFSQQWMRRQILAPLSLQSRTNTFDFIFHQGIVSASVNGHAAFEKVAPPKNSNVSTNEFYLGLGAFNDSNSTVLRYRNVQVRWLTAPDSSNGPDNSSSGSSSGGSDASDE